MQTQAPAMTPKQFSDVMSVIAHPYGSWPMVGTIPGDRYHYPKNPNKPSRKVKFSAAISSYCGVWEGDHFRTLAVQPAQWVLDHIRQHMLAIENDTIMFSLRQTRPNDDYTLRAEYNQILGSRVIAVISADSVPQDETK